MDVSKIRTIMDPAGRLMELLLPGGRLDEKAWYPRGMDDFRTGRLAVPEAGLEFYLVRRGDGWLCNAYRQEKERRVWWTEGKGRTRDAAVRRMVDGEGWEDVGWTL